MSNPQKLLELALTLVKDRYEHDSTQAPPMILACQDDEVATAIELDFSSEMAKDLSIEMASMFLKRHPFDASIHISEAWMSHSSAEELASENYTPPSKKSDRVEVLICEVSSKDQYLAVMQKMHRGESGNVTGFTELHRVDTSCLPDNTVVQSRFDFFNGIKRSVH